MKPQHAVVPPLYDMRPTASGICQVHWHTNLLLIACAIRLSPLESSPDCVPHYCMLSGPREMVALNMSVLQRLHCMLRPQETRFTVTVGCIRARVILRLDNQLQMTGQYLGQKDCGTNDLWPRYCAPLPH